jgi:DNA polymerase-1
LDVETYGGTTHPHLRLVQVGTPERVYVADAFQLNPIPALRSFLETYEGVVVLHNAKYDLRVLGFTDPRSWPGDWIPVDTMLAAQLLLAGAGDDFYRPSLERSVARWLGAELPKDHQRADWSGPLTEGMIKYAARDALVLVPLWDRLQGEIRSAGLYRVWQIEQYALPAVVWLEASGAPFDSEAWEALAREARAREDELEKRLQTELGRSFNPRSPKQVLEVLKARGHAVERTDGLTLAGAAGQDPLVRLLLEYREVLKLSRAYGTEWVEKYVDQDGRVRSDYSQIGAVSGRMSSHNPNLQNVPRDPRYRACFRPSPGRLLVKVDYSQIELRVAAYLTDDRRMIEAFQRGEDVHVLVAREVLGISNPTKEDRQKAKAISFGQLYGQGVRGFIDYARAQFGIEFSDEEALRILHQFYKTFTGFRKPRDWAYSNGEDEVVTLSGRRILNAKKLTPSQRMNLPVQGSAADGLKWALGLLWQRRWDLPSDACPVLCVHDELVVECRSEDAQQVMEAVRDCMVRGMEEFLEEVPVEVEVVPCRDWSGGD